MLHQLSSVGRKPERVSFQDSSVKKAHEAKRRLLGSLSNPTGQGIDNTFCSPLRN
jgi:hypothetical protein